MELGTNSGAGDGRTYLQIIWGTIRQRVPEGTPNAEQRVNKKNVTVFELIHKSVAGYLSRIDRVTSDFGDRYVLNIETHFDTYALQLPVNDRITRAFLYRLPNIDLHKPVRISVFSKDDRVYLAAFQEDEKGEEQTVEAYWSRDNPKQLSFRWNLHRRLKRAPATITPWRR